MAFPERLRAKEVSSFQFRLELRYQWVRISLKGYGNLSFRSAKGPKRQTDAFYGCEEDKKTSFLVIYLVQTVHLQQLKGTQCFKFGM